MGRNTKFTSVDAVGSGAQKFRDKEFGSGRESFLRTAEDAVEIIPASSVERTVIIQVTVNTAFAAGDGAAPIFDIGETGSAEKFKADLTTGAAGADLSYAGILSANKALIVTPTAATGSTSTGAITVTAIATP